MRGGTLEELQSLTAEQHTARLEHDLAAMHKMAPVLSLILTHQHEAARAIIDSMTAIELARTTQEINRIELMASQMKELFAAHCAMKIMDQGGDSTAMFAELEADSVLP